MVLVCIDTIHISITLVTEMIAIVIDACANRVHATIITKVITVAIRIGTGNGLIAVAVVTFVLAIDRVCVPIVGFCLDCFLTADGTGNRGSAIAIVFSGRVAGGSDRLGVAISAGTGVGLFTCLSTSGFLGDHTGVAMAGGSNGFRIAVATNGTSEGLYACLSTGGILGDFAGVVAVGNRAGCAADITGSIASVIVGVGNRADFATDIAGSVASVIVGMFRCVTRSAIIAIMVCIIAFVVRSANPPTIDVGIGIRRCCCCRIARYNTIRIFQFCRGNGNFRITGILHKLVSYRLGAGSEFHHTGAIADDVGATCGGIHITFGGIHLAIYNDLGIYQIGFLSGIGSAGGICYRDKFVITGTAKTTPLVSIVDIDTDTRIQGAGCILFHNDFTAGQKGKILRNGYIGTTMDRKGDIAVDAQFIVLGVDTGSTDCHIDR